MNAVVSSNEKPIVCLVEDDEIMRHLFTRAITRAGAAVVVTNGPDDAIPILQSGNIDLIISDYRMPSEKDGLRLLAFVKDNYPELPIFIMSAEMNDETQAVLLANGAKRCLAKPLKTDVVKQILNRE